VSRALFDTTAARVLRNIGVPMLAVPDDQTAGVDEEGVALQPAA